MSPLPFHMKRTAEAAEVEPVMAPVAGFEAACQSHLGQGQASQVTDRMRLPALAEALAEEAPDRLLPIMELEVAGAC